MLGRSGTAKRRNCLKTDKLLDQRKKALKILSKLFFENKVSWKVAFIVAEIVSMFSSKSHMMKYMVCV
ncbi:hypothetical protein V6N12_057446 [Hibiscus sabdariffa]|uniref:Uncharacterized protein n=1 Tax=Hibiscus sabdariffa TaxID=183260 RepID=A0ABR2C592_9ROSI